MGLIFSMTGYGCAVHNLDDCKYTVEVKGVNNRYLDCSVRLPRNLLYCEEIIKRELSSRISRGKIDVFVTCDRIAEAGNSVVLNNKLAEEYFRAITDLSERFKLEKGISATDLARMPSVLSLETVELDKDFVSEMLRKLAASATDDFNDMRAREGARLKSDLLEKLEGIETKVAEIERLSPQSVFDYRNKLEQRIRDALCSIEIDEQRILQEVAIFADKTAVDEETVRLRSHLFQFREMLEAGSPIGRKLDFLVQELNRETNTIGSKCNDTKLSSIVIEMKSDLEKVREQVQNIE